MLMSGGKAIQANYTQPLSTRSLFKGTLACLSCKISHGDACRACFLLTRRFHKNWHIIYSVPRYWFSRLR